MRSNSNNLFENASEHFLRIVEHVTSVSDKRRELVRGHCERCIELGCFRSVDGVTVFVEKFVLPNDGKGSVPPSPPPSSFNSMSIQGVRILPPPSVRSDPENRIEEQEIDISLNNRIEVAGARSSSKVQAASPSSGGGDGGR